MILDIVAAVGLALAVLPAAMCAVNLFFYQTPRRADDEPSRHVSVLIPARNEETKIRAAVSAALASRDIDLEVVVMDDHSTDRTADIVRAIAAEDPRVRLESAPELPPGWGGKMHACQSLAAASSAPILVFLDADVVLAPDGIARAVGFLERSGADLVSGIPRQLTGTFLEKLVIPLIHFVLLGYLPFPGMRWSTKESFAAGCGQLFIARREPYERAGGHAAIRTTYHDGLQLPRSFRRAGARTDLFDATRVAVCRMYFGARDVIEGLAKNAHEGMAGPTAIWVWSALLLGGQVLPPLLAAVGAVVAPGSTWFKLAIAATALGFGTRAVLGLRFRQSVVGVLLHPLGVLVLVGIQWYARARRASGRGIAWKGRVQVNG